MPFELVETQMKELNQRWVGSEVGVCVCGVSRRFSGSKDPM